MAAFEIACATSVGTLIGTVNGVIASRWLHRRAERNKALPSSRANCIEALRAAMERPPADQRYLGILMLDCDRFKLINDAYGYAVGDLVLNEVARRIKQAAPPGHQLLNLGSDEFIVLLPDVKDTVELSAVAARLVDAFDAPLEVSSQRVYTGVSIGGALTPLHGRHPESVLAAAESGLRGAKRAGRRTVRLYDAQAGSRELKGAHALQQLRRAFDGGQMLLHYQPKIHLADGTCAGFEALLRLRATQKVEGPGALIEAAERSGFISPLGEWVFQQASAQSRLWHGAGIHVPIAVNLSARQLQDDRFLSFVEAQLVHDPELPRRLQLEITETSLAQDHLQFAGALSRLRSRGFDIQVDDFGTGYSTMGFLSRMPVNTLKIDRSFIAGLPESKDCQQLVRAMIGMAHELGLCVVAEGVETQAQAQWLRQHGCDQAQGFLFSRALPPEQAAEFARAERRAPQAHAYPSVGSDSHRARDGAGVDASTVLHRGGALT